MLFIIKLKTNIGKIFLKLIRNLFAASEKISEFFNVKVYCEKKHEKDN